MGNAIKWLKTSGLTVLGGGIIAIFGAVMDPTKYRFPEDLGSGRMWKFFFMGAGLTFGSLLLKSPLGQKALTAYRESQRQLEEDQATVEKLKAELQKKKDGNHGDAAS